MKLRYYAQLVLDADEREDDALPDASAEKAGEFGKGDLTGTIALAHSP